MSVIGRTIAESTPAFDPRPTAPAGAPNVVVVVLDDLGFGQLGCFGSDIGTPAIDRLAADGLRFNRFHVTALCSPTRACLLTGRNHHDVGMGFLTDVPIGFPGYNGRIPTSAAALPRLLRDRGWSTFAVGKWHLAPRWEQSASGPFDRWPLGLGFERYYGFLAGDTNQWTPDLVSDNGFIEPPATPGEGYHLTEDLVDRAIRLIRDQQHATPDRPFFLYLATGAMHAPHHVPRPWADAYAGAFDDGWDAWRTRLFDRQVASGIVPDGTALTHRPSWVPAWGSLSADERRLYARFMEVFAGFLSHTDAQLARLVAFLEEIGRLDDTMLIVLSDNGTSAEGGPVGTFNEHRFTHDRTDDVADTLSRIDELGGFTAYNHYPWGWAWAGNTPLRLWKRYTWLGGVRTPLIVRWPGAVDDGGAVRGQFCHAIDVLPTVLEACGIEAPGVVDGITQQPIAGRSLMPALRSADAPSPRDTQYFEMLGSRAIYHRGWKATTDHIGRQLTVEVERLEGSLDFEHDHWALFHLEDDFSEAYDLSGSRPDLVREMEARWWTEAGRHNVLPLDDTFIGRAVAMVPGPNLPRWRTVYRPGGGAIAEDFLPGMGGGFSLHARFSSSAPVEGVLCACGDWSNGWALYVLDGRPVATFNLFGSACTAASSSVVGAGSHLLTLTYERAPAGGGPFRLVLDDAVVGEGEVPHDLPFRWQIGGAGLLLGRDAGFPVCGDYAPPFAFTGELHDVTIDIPLFAPPDAAEHVLRALRHE
jgi:arylsulfatase A-like enzyme